MSTNLPAERKPQLMAGAPVAALVPQSLEEAFRLAGALAASGMAPRGIEKPEQIMVAIMAGAELGLAPFQALQSFAVVNGRPTLWGDGLMAVVRARGVRVKEWLDGEGDGMVAHCVATRPDTGEEIARAFTVPDAKKAGLWGKQGPWQQYPKRMLQMRARALALRDGCADMLRGIQVREEVEDYQPIREVRVAPPPGLAARLTAAGPSSEGFNASQAEHPEAEFTDDSGRAALDQALDGDTVPDHNATAGEILEQDLPGHADEPDDEGFPGDRQSGADEVDVQAWARGLIADDAQLQSVEQIEAFFADKEATRRYRALEAAAPVLAKTLVSALNGRKKAAASKAAG